MPESVDRPERSGDTVREGTHIAFGNGRARGLAADVIDLIGGPARVMLLADPGMMRGDVLDRLVADLTAARCDVRVDCSIAGEPQAADVDAAVSKARAQRAELVIAVGGGSVIDVAKLVAVLCVEGLGSAGYALGAQPLPSLRLPIIAVPTTAGTGAEVTRTAVFTIAEGSRVWAWGEGLRPDLAILDPELTISLPRALTVATGVDALVHAVEATTNRSALPGTDLPAMQAIATVRAYLPRAVAHPNDLDARGAMLRAACLAGKAIDRAGTGVAHALGHGLGALAGVAHGRAVGLGLRAAIGWNAQAAPGSHAAVAEAFGIERAENASDEALAHDLANALDAFLRQVDLPISLTDAGLHEGDAERLAEATLRPENATMLAANCRGVDEGDALHLSRTVLAAV